MARLHEWEQEIVHALGADTPWRVVCFERVGSTMDEARELARGVDIQGPTLVLAREQSAGRGRQGRSWQQAHGAFMGTIVLPSELSGNAFSGFSLAIGVAVARVCEGLGLSVVVKWPNDVLLHSGKKLCGVLIELLHRPEGTTALIGIGVNLAEAPASESAAAGMGAHLTTALSPPQFASLFLPALESVFQEFRGHGFQAFREEWEARSTRPGTFFRVDTGSEILQGSFSGVDDDGALLLSQDGALHRVISGHVMEMSDRA